MGNGISIPFSLILLANTSDWGLGMSGDENTSLTSPSITISPLFNTKTLSAYRATSSGLWDTKTIVLPCSFSLSKTEKILSFPSLSKPAAISSKTKTSGSIAIIPARAALLFSPPDKIKGDLYHLSFFRPTVSNAFSASLIASSLLLPLFLGPKETSEITLSSNSCDSGY